MAKQSIIVTVPANPDLDDCLEGAREAYLAEHPEVEDWQVEAEWADETREAVTLTVT